MVSRGDRNSLQTHDEVQKPRPRNSKRQSLRELIGSDPVDMTSGVIHAWLHDRRERSPSDMALCWRVVRSELHNLIVGHVHACGFQVQEQHHGR